MSQAYSVIIVIQSDEANHVEASLKTVFANDVEEAIANALSLNKKMLSQLANGYYITAKYAELIDPSICPMNHEALFAEVGIGTTNCHGAYFNLSLLNPEKEHHQELVKDLNAIVQKYTTYTDTIQI